MRLLLAGYLLLLNLVVLSPCRAQFGSDPPPRLAIHLVPDLGRYSTATRTPLEQLNEWSRKYGDGTLPPFLRGTLYLKTIVPPEYLTQSLPSLRRQGEEARERRQWDRAEAFFHAALRVAEEKDDRIGAGLTYQALAALERDRKRPVWELTYLLARVDAVDHRAPESVVGPACERLGELLTLFGDESGGRIAFARARTVRNWEEGRFLEKLAAKYPPPKQPLSAEEAARVLDLSTGQILREGNPGLNALTAVEDLERYFLATLHWSEAHTPEESEAWECLAALENLRRNGAGELGYLLRTFQSQILTYGEGFRVDTLLEIGRVCLELGETEAARAALHRAFAYRVFRNERQHILFYLSRLTDSFRENLGDYVSALAVCDLMRRISQGRSRWLAVGRPYNQTRDQPQGYDYSASDVPFQILACLEAARTYLAIGEFNEALEPLLAADQLYQRHRFAELDIFQREEARRDQDYFTPSPILLHLALGEVWEQAGQIQHGFGYFKRMEEVIEKFVRLSAAGKRSLGYKEGARIPWRILGEISSVIGFAAARNSRWQEAYRHLQDARHHIEVAGREGLIEPFSDLRSLSNVFAPHPYSHFFLRLFPRQRLALGVTCRELGRMDEAREHLETALTAWQKIGEPESVALCWLEISETERRRRNLTAALEALKRAATQLDGVSAPVAKLRLLDRIADAFATLGEHNEAIPRYQEALSLLDTLEARLLEPAQREMLRQTDIGGLFDRYALALYRQGKRSPLELLELVEQGRLRSFQNEGRADERFWEQATEEERLAVEQGRRELARLGRRVRALAGTGSQEERKRVQDALRATEESLRLLQLRVRTRLARSHPTTPARSPREAIARVARQHPGTLFIRWVVTESETLLFWMVGGRNGASLAGCERLRLGRSELSRRVEGWRRSLTGTTLEDIPEERNRANQLFKVLTGPLNKRGLLEPGRVRRLVLVPDGPLHDVPFAALALEPSGKSRLIDRWPVSCALSLALLDNPENKNPESSRKKIGSLLCVADPLSDLPSTKPLTTASLLRNGLEPLPFAREEVKGIGRLFPNSLTLSGSEAQEERIKQELSRYRILHFATHGIPNERNGLRSWLLLAEETDASGEDGRLEAEEIAGLTLQAQMVVLSACRSGLARTGTSAGSREGILGFAWALQQAGCPSMVTTLGDVEDAATSRLIIRFYRELQTGKPKDEALRAAMLTERANPRSLPRQWALLRVTGSCTPLSAARAEPQPRASKR